MKSKQELIEKWELAIESAEFYGRGREDELISYMKEFVSDLNQLVPKQEEIKVPEMWHDVIVQNKEDGHSLRWTLNYIDDLNVNDVDSFARAWIAYPNIEVEEEEQKFYVDLNTAAYVAKWDGNGQVDIYTDGISGSDEYELLLTEQEIKGYDERFWPFRKPAEEVDEW